MRSAPVEILCNKQVTFKYLEICVYIYIYISRDARTEFARVAIDEKFVEFCRIVFPCIIKFYER